MKTRNEFSAGVEHSLQFVSIKILYHQIKYFLDHLLDLINYFLVIYLFLTSLTQGAEEIQNQLKQNEPRRFLFVGEHMRS